MRTQGRRPRRVLLVGNEPPVRSAPLVTLARELRAIGVEAVFSQGVEENAMRAWLGLAWHHDALAIVHYGRVGMLLQRQVHLADLLGCMAVRWWVGTDVLLCLQSPEVAASARALDAAVGLNIAVAPHLVQELASIGIRATYVPSVCDLSALERAPPEGLPRGILVYLPTARKDFYGFAAVRRAVEDNPDLPFIIVSDDSHSLARYSNVTSLGWVSDMDPVWAQVGALLRITQHDGMPRMALEALARGRYVIYSRPMVGCWLAETTEQIQAQLDRFKAARQPNTVGREAAWMTAASAAQSWVDAVADGRAARASTTGWIPAAVRAIRCQRAFKNSAQVSRP